MDPGRRDFVLSALGCTPFSSFAQMRPWDSKDPSAYSQVDKNRLLTSSPWAKTVHPEPPAAENHPPGYIVPSSSPKDALATHGTARVGGIAETEEPKRRDQDKAFAFYGPVTVRWESAEPILRLSGTQLPNEFRDHYAIGVTGLPAAVLAAKPSATQPSATLTPTHSKAELADQVMLTADKQTLVFAFPVSGAPIGARTKRAVFAMALGGIDIKASFTPAEMMYRGRLAL